MSLLAVNFCKQLRYRLGNEISSTIVRRYNGVMFEEQPNQPIKSKLFPDYDVIYVYPTIYVAYLSNKVKRNYTAFAVANIPITTALQMLDIVSLPNCIGCISFAFILAIPVHTFCYYWNNTVGSIYFKEQESKVIISYVNYWGKRINLTVNKDDVLPFMEVPFNDARNRFIRVKIASFKPTLKMYMKNAQIYKPSVFYNIFGELN